MVDVRMLAKYRSMAQLVRSECVPTLLMSMPRRLAPIVLTVDLMCVRSCFEVKRTCFPRAKNVLTGVSALQLS